MKKTFEGWATVSTNLNELANNQGIDGWNLNEGQQRSLRALATRLPKNGVVVADEVGMGKTRIAVALANAVNAAGGRVAIVVPPSLGYQWQDELQAGGVNSQAMIRSLWQFLKVWENGNNTDVIPWFQQDTVIISHAFCNWRLSESSDAWRWALLPEVFANLRKLETKRYPNGYHDNDYLDDQWIRNAGQSIAEYAWHSKTVEVELVVEEISETPWPGSLDGGKYSKYGSYRELLEKTVGLGFGEFDLVIIDEAHKSRGEDSNLNRLLNNILVCSAQTRRLAMTATPIELAALQWEQTFSRINVKDECVNEAIKDYEHAINEIRKRPNDSEIKQNFVTSAVRFKKALSPYLLRRDKREESELQDFSIATGRPIYEYRRQSPIEIEVGDLSDQWKRIVCAAEALSFTASQKTDSAAKRLRLTLSNGHGIGNSVSPSEDDRLQDVEDVLQNEGTDVVSAIDSGTSSIIDLKRQLRSGWWKSSIRTALSHSGEVNDTLLFNHPAILKTVIEIEKTIKGGEKVLVFGRYTAPIRALNHLLNARAMLRHLDNGEPWPQMKLRDDDSELSEWNAVQAAHKQLKLSDSLSIEALNNRLKSQYYKLDALRRSYRENLIDNIAEGLQALKSTDNGQHVFCDRSQVLFDSLKERLSSSVDVNLDDYLSRAMIELTGLDQNTIQQKEYAEAFVGLMNALADKGEGDTDGDGKLDDNEAAELWNVLKARMVNEYSAHEAGYSRLMVGSTKPEARRMLQLAFNRENSKPKVLIAQSLVGREGLNLHLACKTVVLFHLEWNPGVVEQQIGRVDRVNSLWSNQMKAWKEQQDGECPQIQIRPVVFKGTYDEMNWDVLSTRWKNLQAQLHGMIIPPDSAEGCSEELIKEINEAAPRFSP